MTHAAIRTHGLHKSYRSGIVETRVLNGVELEVEAGQCVFLVGPSGSGKSTLLSILGCVLSPDQGSVEILGEDIRQLDDRQLARFRREQIGFVFQRFHLFDGLRAAENVRVALDLLGWSARAAKREALRLLDLMGLADKAFCFPSKLSGGERQRVALARALAGNPRLLLADEPTAALDFESGMRAMELLRALAKESGATVFVVTHDPRIFPLADRILTMQDGRITGPLPAAADAPANDSWVEVSIDSPGSDLLDADQWYSGSDFEIDIESHAPPQALPAARETILDHSGAVVLRDGQSAPGLRERRTASRTTVAVASPRIGASGLDDWKR